MRLSHKIFELILTVSAERLKWFMQKQFFYKLNYREADMKQNTETWMGIRGVIKLYEKIIFIHPDLFVGVFHSLQ